MVQHWHNRATSETRHQQPNFSIHNKLHPPETFLLFIFSWLCFVAHLCPSSWVVGRLGGSVTPFVPLGWAGHSKMAALASSLIRQRREVKDHQANRQISNKRKPCPKSNKSLCQKQILILISKVRLCGSRGRKLEKRPGELKQKKSFNFSTGHHYTLKLFFLRLCVYKRHKQPVLHIEANMP